jgi:hypothetical protein
MASGNQSRLLRAQLEAILEMRRRRSAIFGEGLFSDPAWDILLELFAAELGGRRLGLADLDHIAPRSTLARWLTALGERGLVLCAGPLRPDEMRVALSRACSTTMTRLLSGALDLARLD